MATVECGKGHLYDPSIYSVCPYCNSAQRSIHFGGTAVTADGHTAPITGAGHSTYQEPQRVTDMGKTMPPRGYRPSTEQKVTDSKKTVGVMKENLGIDPVVGWLICVEGSQKGKDYRIKGQINTIGRSEAMDICIQGDTTISSENHARISYSDRNNRFLLIPAESKNIIYLNGEEIFAATELAAFDMIEFGRTKLMFLPLCCDRFDWQRGLHSSEKENGND